MSDAFVIVYILGAGQGIFLAAILVSRQRDSVPNRLLALTMLAFSVDLAMAVYHASGFDAAFPHLIGIDYPLAFLYGPLLFLYARTLSRQDHHFRRVYLWHFLPFALLTLYLSPFFLSSGAEKLAFMNGREPNPLADVLGVVNHLKIVHALTYVTWTLVLLRYHRRSIRDAFSYTERINLTWLRNFMVGIVTLTGVVVILYLVGLGDDGPAIGLNPDTLYDDFTLLGLAVFVYGIGFMGLRQPEVFDQRWADAVLGAGPRFQSGHPKATPQPSGSPQNITGPRGIDASDVPADSASVPEDDRALPRYAKSGMDLATARAYRDALVELMETERIYRRGDLTLIDLSDALRISTHNLTEVINTQLGQNFYDFVNGYRVDEVCSRLSNPDHDHFTLLAIATDSGFNSKSSFNAVFKKHTGMTPSEYKRQQIAQRDNNRSIPAGLDDASRAMQ